MADVGQDKKLSFHFLSFLYCQVGKLSTLSHNNNNEFYFRRHGYVTREQSHIFNCLHLVYKYKGIENFLFVNGNGNKEAFPGFGKHDLNRVVFIKFSELAYALPVAKSEDTACRIINCNIVLMFFRGC